MRKSIMAVLTLPPVLVLCACGGRTEAVSGIKNAYSGEEQTNEAVLADPQGKAEAENGVYSKDTIVAGYGFHEISFGSFHGQDIEWLVISEQDGKKLLLSKYGLDSREYHETSDPVSWENCTLRSWLNGEFFDEAFSDEEVRTYLGPWDNKNACMLKAICYPTPYAAERGETIPEIVFGESAKLKFPGTCFRHVRNHDTINHYNAMAVECYGAVGTGHETTDGGICVRPAMWVNG